MCPLESTICSNHHGAFTRRQVSSPFRWLAKSSLINVFIPVGKICVPIDPKRPDDFDCSRVPTLTQVINEMGTMSADKRTREEGDSLTPPCLEPFMATFKEFLETSRKLQINSIKEANKAKQSASAAATNMDF